MIAKMNISYIKPYFFFFEVFVSKLPFLHSRGPSSPEVDDGHDHWQLEYSFGYILFSYGRYQKFLNLCSRGLIRR